MTTGSGAARPEEGTTAMDREMRRPSGLSWSSGTSKWAHWASTGREPAVLSAQDSKSIEPNRCPVPEAGALEGAQPAIAAARGTASRQRRMGPWDGMALLGRLERWLRRWRRVTDGAGLRR